MSTERRIDPEEHLEYILKKEKRTLSLWDEIMHRTVTWSDFPYSEKPVTIVTDSDSDQQTKSTKDKSTTDKNIEFKIKVKKSHKENKWFPFRRVQDE